MNGNDINILLCFFESWIMQKITSLINLNNIVLSTGKSIQISTSDVFPKIHSDKYKVQRISISVFKTRIFPLWNY